MSSQKGNVARSRPQKHQNTFTFKNDKFDKSVQTKLVHPKETSFQITQGFINQDELVRNCIEKQTRSLLMLPGWQAAYVNVLQLQKINAKLHDGVCQRCKEVLEWRVKYSKYKPLSKPKKCVKCLQKTVKDSYHIICRPCACELEVCAKCGKKEDIVIPFNKEPENSANTENQGSNCRQSCRGEEDSDEDLDADTDSDAEDGDS